MKAINIYTEGSGPAPKAWEEIPIIKESRPSPIGQEVSLQRVSDTNIAIWYTRRGIFWRPASDPFLVIE